MLSIIYIRVSLIESKNQSVGSREYQNGHESCDNTDICIDSQDMAIICNSIRSSIPRHNFVYWLEQTTFYKFLASMIKIEVSSYYVKRVFNLHFISAAV